MRHRKHFTREFKLEAVLLLGKPSKEIRLRPQFRGPIGVGLRFCLYQASQVFVGE